MNLVNLKDDIFIRSVLGIGGSRIRVLGEYGGFQTRDMDNRVMLGVMDDAI